MTWLFRRAWLAAALLFWIAGGGMAAEPAGAEHAHSHSLADELEDEPANDNPIAEQTGWVKANSSHPNVDAPFTIVDGTGRIRSYVRPAPGVDMKSFVDHKVRVRGPAISDADAATLIVEADEVEDPEGPRRPGTRRRGALRGANRGIQKVAFEESIPGGPEEIGAPVPAGEGQGDSSAFETQQDWSQPYAGMGSCGSCGQPSCGACCQRLCGPPGRVWVRAEYLYWWTQGMHIPPLVTTAPTATAATNPGYIGAAGTQILFGGNRVDGYGRSGGRLTLGAWLDPCQTIGIEGDYFQLMTATSHYSATSGGDPLLSRPFFDIRPALEDQNVEKVAFPNQLAGTVTVDTYTKLLGAGARLRINLCCSSNCYFDYCIPNMNGAGGYRLDALLGYRYLRLSDGVQVNEYLTSLSTENPGSFHVNDTFRTVNQFNGIDLGTAWLGYRGRWSLELISRLALGNTNQMVGISGFTTNTVNGVSTTNPGGLLALPSNIGQYSRNSFSAVPELGANLGILLTPRLKATVGYTFIFWSNVARAGDQIDTTVNSNYLPNAPTPPGIKGAAYPLFAFHESPFWAQGISAGLEYRW